MTKAKKRVDRNGSCRIRQKLTFLILNFQLGPAWSPKKGTIYQGINIENASFGLTNCAERTAFFKAISEGEKKTFNT